MSGTIVVGVDGSEASREALRFGAEEAALREARLVAVHAWLFIPPQPLGDPGILAVPAGDLAGQLSAENDSARLALDEAVADALGAEPSVEIERRLVEGDAGESLVAQSAEARSRRRGLARALRTQGRAARLRQPARRRPRDVPRRRRQSARVDRSQRRGCGAAAFRDSARPEAPR